MPRLVFLSPLSAAAVGALIAYGAGLSPAAFATNVAGVALGALVGFAIRRAGAARLRRHAWRAGAAAGALIAGSLVGRGLGGVHRWLPIGPFSLNASSAFVPWVVFALACAPGPFALCLLAGVQMIHVAQPDAAQAGAVAAASVVVAAAMSERSPRWRAACAGLGVLGLVGAALRHDDLAPVAHVEGILSLAHAQGGLVMAAALLAATSPVALGLGIARSTRTPLAWAFVAYALTTFVAGVVGTFPIPMLGAGAGPALGAMTYFALAQVDLRAELEAAVIDP